MSVDNVCAACLMCSKTGIYLIAVNKRTNRGPRSIAGSKSYSDVDLFVNERLEQVPSFYQAQMSTRLGVRYGVGIQGT